LNAHVAIVWGRRTQQSNSKTEQAGLKSGTYKGNYKGNYKGARGKIPEENARMRVAILAQEF